MTSVQLRTTPMRFDTRGSTWTIEQHFPVVSVATGKAHLESVFYSSAALEGKHYRFLPIRGGEGWFVDENLTTNNETFSSTLSSLNAAVPQMNSYISMSHGQGLGGASAGLAIALAILGCPTVISTGFLMSFGDSDSIIYPVDHLDAKIASIEGRRGMIVPETQLWNRDVVGPVVADYYDTGRFYRWTNLVAGTAFSINRFAACCARDLLDAAQMAEQIALHPN